MFDWLVLSRLYFVVNSFTHTMMNNCKKSILKEQVQLNIFAIISSNIALLYFEFRPTAVWFLRVCTCLFVYLCGGMMMRVTHNTPFVCMCTCECLCLLCFVSVYTTLLHCSVLLLCILIVCHTLSLSFTCC